MAQKLLERTVSLVAEAGACSFEMVAADGTFIEAPSSTKNKAHARDPEMASGKKANTWHFGMKEHIAACSESGIIYGTVAAPANEHDITQGDLLKGLEKMVFLDSGYIGCATSAASHPANSGAACGCFCANPAFPEKPALNIPLGASPRQRAAPHGRSSSLGQAE
ncbi:MAG: transposase [Sutterella wadsworthensis]|uniref:transposase n=1 Tax=Sutterella wadsworthensis TaxID=40545 RepID=UPI0011C8165B|nr:transposase [Sutterella wadsworthensis]